jgi:competence protein ComEC
VLQGLSDAVGFFDRDIDIVVATHPDQDHIGGLIDVLERYAVGAIVMTENRNDTNVSDMFYTYVENEGAEIIYARAGQVLDLGMGEAGSTTLSILFPDRDPTGFESNTASIVARLSYGDTDFLLTGDAPATVEGFLVETYGNGLQSEVLKVGHHGSRTSTSEDFLMTVAPEYAVISAGKDNSYGHPHVEVTDLVFNHRVEIKNTAEDGSIIFESNGTQLWLK